MERRRIMKHATSRELYEYWNRVRGSRPAPQRNEITPAAIKHILADTFILEVDNRDHFPVRLAGTRLCGLYCREIKSEDFLDLWAPDDRNAIATLATAVAVDDAAAVMTSEARGIFDKSVTCEILLLPLSRAGPHYDRILGCCAPFERPYWIGAEPVAQQRLTSLRLIWPDEKPHFIRRPGAQSSLPQIPLPLATNRKHQHLTVFDGGKQ